MAQRNTVAFMHHMMRVKHSKLLQAYRKQASEIRTGLSPLTGDTENVRMSEKRIYVGLNDADTGEQIYDTDKYLDMMKKVCRKYHVAFSVDIEEGGYYHENGEYTEETSIVLIMIDTEDETVKKIARDLCELFHQESVLVTESHVDGCFISRD